MTIALLLPFLTAQWTWRTQPMRSSHVALVIASHHGLLFCVRIPYSHTSHCEEMDEGFNASVKKNYSLGLYYNLNVREMNQQEVEEICMMKNSTINTPHQISVYPVR
jgi:hypothetical protein